MFVSRVLSRVCRSVSRSSTLLTASERPQQLPILSNQFHSLVHPSPNTVIPVQVNSLWLPINASSTLRCGFSSSASPEPNEKENGNKTADPAKTTDDAESSDSATQTKESGSISESQSESVKRRRVTKRTAFSDSDSESETDLSRDDLVKLVAEKEELLKLKQKDIEKMQDKVLRTLAEMENVMDRTRREAENSKKFAIQNFAKSLLDVADNLGRASSVVKDSFSKIDTSKDSSGAAPLLKTLLEGVEMTDKQLSEVLKKFGVEKFDPTNEPFDPHRHNAVFQVPDASKPAGTVAAVLKAGYMLYDRVIRPAEVGVTHSVEDNNTTENGNSS
ncbi:grpE protein-like protein 2, mitochondrial-like isoform X1 [Senna tora]|uniref:GrpE protein homolog n=1 Tax=Senna tora TaxID=362788 RepID=A0A834T473_9FABA|nr:grpE protein-like protein 2, mitochondrial-like isoform X1 [Senna tora]